MANEQTKKKIDEVAEALLARGFAEKAATRGECGRRLFLPSKRRETYLGTFLNPYTVLDRDGRPLLWSDDIALECAEVVVEPVYRHNGTAEDVSVGVTVYAWHTAVLPFPEKYAHDAKNPEFVRIVESESPTNYLKEGVPVCSCASGRGVRVAKLKNTAGERAIAHAVEKALAECEAFVPRDHSAHEKDRSRYHADTTAEYIAWLDAHKGERAAAARA